MLQTYNYRLLQSSWGIAIDMEATVEAHDYAAIDYEMIAGRFTRRQLDCLRKGVSLSGQNVKVCIKSIRYNPCDYQDEGLAMAVCDLICIARNIPKRKIEVHYDKEQGRYIYNFPFTI